MASIRRSLGATRKSGLTRFVLKLAVRLVLAIILVGERRASLAETAQNDEQRTPTFARDVAPIIFNHCSGCHRPGQPAPFSLLTYNDVSKHAVDIVKVVRTGFMPPWLPESGYGVFEDEQRLTPGEIQRIEKWVRLGVPEGEASETPSLPKWNDHWQLGKPDLILQMPEAYTLPAEGADEYRNFVIPANLTSNRFVKGVEFRPANPKIVHHAFIRIDRTSQSRRLDQNDREVGFPGIITPAEIPDGHFLDWQPGRVPTFVPQGLAWSLAPNSDVVLQMHLRKTGKPESVQAEVGFFFTDQVPTNTPFRLQLGSFSLDIPAGETNYVVEDDFTIPIDAHALAVLPHAHYLAREMRAWATLPNGATEPLLHIKNWDFDWHSDYRYKQPVFLPAGSRVAMRFSFDNSTNNVRNPSHPPKRVLYGPQATDEMAQLFLQLLPRRRDDLPVLKREIQLKTKRLMYGLIAGRLEKNPNDAEALSEMSLLLMGDGKKAEAREHALKAVRVGPESPAAHYQMGLVYRQENQLSAAQREFETTLQFDPKHSKANGNLGFIHLERGNLRTARQYFENALRLNPDDELARKYLDELVRISTPTQQ